MATDLAPILNLRVPVIVQVGRRRITLEQVLDLTPGAVLELEKDADSPLPLLVNNKAIAAGTAVKVTENYGLRITRLGDAAQRVEALGATNDDGNGNGNGNGGDGQ